MFHIPKKKPERRKKKEWGKEQSNRSGGRLATTLGYWRSSDQPDCVHLCFRWDRVPPHLTMKTKPRHFNQGETQAYNSQALYLKIIQYRAFSVQERIPMVQVQCQLKVIIHGVFRAWASARVSPHSSVHRTCGKWTFPGHFLWYFVCSTDAQ